MANLKTFSGFPIQNLTSDPVPFAQAKTNDPYAGVWSSGGAMNTARFLVGGAGSSNSAALAFGGRTSAPANVALTENYNGTAWTEVADLPAAKSYAAGAGTSTAALSIGGSSPAVPTTSGKTESWNGSSWTEITALGRGPTSPSSTTYGSGSGSTTSALFYASDETTNANNRTESWNGSSWTELADQNTARSYAGGVGTNNSSAIMMGGLIYPPSSAKAEVWDGSSWTEVGDLNQARYSGSVSSQGSATLALYFAGKTPPNASQALTESWDGTSWTEVADLSTARRSGSSGGTATSAIIGGGSTSGSSPGHVATTEEWAFSGIPPTAPAAGYSDAIVGQMYYNSTSGQFKAIKSGGAPLGTWSSGGNLNLAGDSFAGYGTKTATGKAGGRTTPGPSPALTTSVATHEQYNGTSWTEVGDLNQQRWLAEASGIQTSAIIYGGANPGSATPVLNTETWNGSSWTEVADLATARRSFGGAGIASTAALAYGGRMGSSYPANTESWNGSSWSEVNNLNEARAYTTGGGTHTDAILVGGYDGSSDVGSFEQWDGTSWTEAADLNTARQTTSSGTTTQAMAFAGSGPSAKTEAFNGTSWTEVADLATGRYDANTGGSTGSPTSTIIYGGYSTTYTNITEEWSAADFTINPVTTS